MRSFIIYGKRSVQVRKQASGPSVHFHLHTFQIKKNSKRRFKYEVRRLRRHRNHIQCENLANAISYSNPQEFWKQVKKLSKPSSGAMSSSSIIDGCNNDIEISSIFASKLESLLNSVPDTSRTNLQHRVKESITPSALSCCYHPGNRL